MPYQSAPSASGSDPVRGDQHVDRRLGRVNEAVLRIGALDRPSLRGHALVQPVGQSQRRTDVGEEEDQ